MNKFKKELEKIEKNGKKLRDFFAANPTNIPAKIKNLQAETENMLKNLLAKTDYKEWAAEEIPGYEGYNGYTLFTDGYLFVKNGKYGLEDVDVETEEEQILDAIVEDSDRLVEEIEEKTEELNDFFADYNGEDEIPEEIEDLQKEIESRLNNLDWMYYMDYAGGSGQYPDYGWFTTDVDATVAFDYYVKYGEHGLEDVIIG